MEEKASLVRICMGEQQIPMAELREFVSYTECGAVVSFEGVVRQTEGGSIIPGLDYEHHESMAERELRKVVNSALNEFDVRRIACVHRVGYVPVGEASVAIVVGSDHRPAAFDVCEYVIDELKKSVPIWKQPALLQSASDGRMEVAP